MLVLERFIAFLSDIALVIAVLVFLALLEIIGYGLFIRLAIGDSIPWMRAVEFGDLASGRPFYFRPSFYLILILFLVALVIADWVRRSRIGRGGGAAISGMGLGLIALALGVGGLVFAFMIYVRAAAERLSLTEAVSILFREGVGDQPMAIIMLVLPAAAIVLTLAGARRILRTARMA